MSEMIRIAKLLFQDQPYRDNGMYKEQLLELDCMSDVDRDVMSIVERGSISYSSILN